MMRRHFSMKVLAWIIAFSLCIPYGFAQEVGKITYVEGRVDILKGGSDKGVPAIEYDNISVGDSLRTKSNSKVEIKFKDESIVRLAQNSKMEIKDYQLDEKNKRKAAAIKLERGKLRTIVSKSPQAADFAIITPNSQGVVKGSDVFAFYQAGSSGLLVADGKVALTSVAHPQDSIVVPAGSSALVPLEKLPEGPRPYLEIEKKLHEQDTEIPFSGAKAAKLTVITGTIAKFSGKVLITTKGQTKPHDAKIGEVVKEGDLIETLENSLVEIRLDNNNAINMKPNSKLFIIKLALNPQTQEYENIFELTIGKIKARIEGLKGKSKFEVKTPLAICGARGTILYVTALPNVTSSFLEGGNGYIINNADGTLNDIPAGQQGSVTLQGTFYTSGLDQNDRQGFTDGWDPGTGVEGYSAPEGSTGGYLYGSDTGTGNNTGNNTGAGTNTGANSGEPVDLPVSESNPGTITTTITAGQSFLSGNFSGAFGFYEDELDEYGHPRGLILDCGTINNGVITATNSIWAGSAQPITLNADFNFTDLDSNHDLDLWASTEDFNLSGSAEGAIIAGIIGGIKNNNSLKGFSYDFYIRPDGSVGYLKSADLAGSLSGMPSGTLNLTGTITAHEMGTSTFPLAVQGFSEDDDINGKVGGDISGVMDLSHAVINGQHWGLWRAGLGGADISTSLSNNWSAVAGGKDVSENDTFYFLMDIKGTSAGNNELFATINGIALDYDPDLPRDFGWLTTIVDGELRGIYDNARDVWWEAIAAGAYTETPLTFGGESTGAFGYYDYDAEEPDVYLNNGSFSALVGGTNSLWGTSTPFTLIGEFANAGTYKLWGTAEEDFTGDTTDGAHFLGIIGGIKLGDNSLKGLSYAFYIRPVTGGYRAGYLKSNDISGNFYSSIGMFKADGHFSSYLDLPTTVTPSELYDGSLKFEYDGTGRGLISGATFSGTISSESASIIDQNWSLWRAGVGGTYSSLPTPGSTARIGGWSYDEDEGTGETTSYWLGSFSVVDNFSGTVDVITLGDGWLGHSWGDVIGTYDPAAKTWESLSAGVHIDETPLTSSGRFVAQEWNAGEVNFYFDGQIGLIGPIWAASSTPNFISLGKFNSGGLNQFAWELTKDGATGEVGLLSKFVYTELPLTYRYTTYPDGSGIGSEVGAFVGLGAGVGGSGSLIGKIYSLYIGPTLEAGVLYGDVNGNYYDGIGMYRLDGTFTKNFHNNVSIFPGELHNNISWDTLSGSPDGGSFAGSEVGGPDVINFSGTMLNITGQNWGIWNFVTNGTYDGPTSDTWDVYDLTGTVTPTADANYVSGSWLGGIGSDTTVGKWSNGEIKGPLDAIWIGLRKDGTLTGRKVNGEVVGNYIEVSENQGTWQAGAAGEWVEVISVLDKNNLTNDIIALGAAANIPISEVYSNTLTGSGSFAAGGVLSNVTMNLNLYSMDPAVADGIWAAIFHGDFSGNTGNSWTMNLSTTNATATLTGTQWNNNQWQATVSGNTTGATSTSFTGQAAGTYNTGAGTFDGSGTGTYTTPAP